MPLPHLIAGGAAGCWRCHHPLIYRLYTAKLIDAAIFDEEMARAATHFDARC